MSPAAKEWLCRGLAALVAAVVAVAAVLAAGWWGGFAP